MSDSVSRFVGFAAAYDQARPTPPTEIVDLLCQWSGVATPDVVDLGAGSGLSTVIWSGRARHVLAVEPGLDMRSVARERIDTLPDAANFSLVNATAEATGLPDGCADVITASQAMHWFDPARVLPEIARLLRPGGVFAAFDCDWPPTVRAEVDAAYQEFDRLQWTLQQARGLQPHRADKEGHLGRMAASGLFSHVRETCLHSRESGDAERLLAVAHSQGGVVALLDNGVRAAELGLDALREIALARLPEPVPWWWTYRIRLAVK
ncbi:MAG TPA: class I SAM-dependent methyltransferase [Pseudonocardiaceae bacterium]|jgi:SAM-dependent methyltransferase|nr:class I SAM-dependent methyltransferase [Pseudonocardiaceae bacterium]